MSDEPEEIQLLRLTLRAKLMSFAVLLALIPVGIVGRMMMVITQDELKSAANDEISVTAERLARDIEELYQNTWLAPLRMVRNAIENGELTGLSTPARDIVDLAWIELDFEGIEPIRGPREHVAAPLREVGFDPFDALSIGSNERRKLVTRGEVQVGEPVHFTATDHWLLTLSLPTEHPAGRRPGSLSARFDLDRLRRDLASHPFQETGVIRLVDATGREIFDPQRPDLSHLELVRRATRVLRDDGSRAIQVAPYRHPSGEIRLGGYAFPFSLDWAVIVERSERDAYLAVAAMRRQLLTWVSLGFLVATVGAIVFSRRLSRPILEIGQAAQEVGRGNLKVRVRERQSGDEVAELARRINRMIRGLRERFELKKFVSGNTMRAIEASDTTIPLGGKRKTATVFFSDIRGFTAFSEKVSPVVVIEMLNTYLRCQAEIVMAHDGDIDKFVGDELVAVFQGEKMVENAVRCALEVQRRVRELNDEPPHWDIAVGIGINTGEMIMGAMGSADRMDYTILGDNVNLGARLCSAAGREQTILSESSYRYLRDSSRFDVVALEPIRVKGKSEPIPVYEVRAPENVGEEVA